jgi:hypothetical protein
MKRIFSTLMAMVLLASAGFAAQPRPLDIQNGDIEKIKDAGAAAIENVLADFVKKRGGESLKSFVLLPLTEDVEGGYFTEKFQSVLADKGRSAGYKLYTREDADIGKLLDEIRWGENFGDTMDQATIQKFGNIKGVQAVIVPRMSISKIDGVITVRASIKGNEVETFANLAGCGEAKQIVEQSLWEKFLHNAVAYKAIIVLLSILVPVAFFVMRAFRNATRPR